MKTRLFISTLAVCLLTSVMIRSQVVNTTFGSVKGWQGSCKVFIVDSTADTRTEYTFEGPATLRNEIDMSPYNTSWPSPDMSAGTVNSGSIEEMMKVSKAQDDKSKVWNSQVKINRIVKYNDGMSNADYTCTLNKTEKRKLQIVITGDNVKIVPYISFSDKLICQGTRDDAAVLPEEDHQLMLNTFDVTYPAPTNGGKRLQGTKTIRDETRRIVVQWDFSPL